MDAWNAVVAWSASPALGFTLLAAGLLVLLLVAHVGSRRSLPCWSPIGSQSIALRERSRNAAYVPLRDPDAPGRQRARAPGLCGPAA